MNTTRNFMDTLSPIQRIAIRKLKGDPDYVASGIDKRTIISLVKRELIENTSGEDYVLTPAGELAFKQIKATGDGPEHLKQMFRIKIRR